MAQTTLQGPTDDRHGPNMTEETPERGWSFKRILDTINTMFTEVYAGIAAAALATDLTTLQGEVDALAARNPNDISTSQDVVTSDAAPEALDLTVYQSKLTTGGSQGAEAVTIGDGTGITVGHRKLVTLETLTDGADSVTLDDGNFSQAADTITAIALDAEGEFLLAEWQGASWEVIAASSGVVTTS